MSNGFIKISRQMLDWQWYTEHNTKIVFLHLLLKASFKENKFKGRRVKPGQCCIAVRKIAEQVELTVPMVRTALDNLKESGAITVEGTNQYSIITIENWEKYQTVISPSSHRDEDQNTNRGHSENNQIATLEECIDCKDYYYDCSNTINGTRLYPTEPIDITDEELQQLVEERTVEL